MSKLVLLITVAAIDLCANAFHTSPRLSSPQSVRWTLPTPSSLPSYSKDWPPLQQGWPPNPGLDSESVNGICLEGSR